MNEIKVQWHSGFVAAVDLELSANRKHLVYEKEYNLNTKPLEIDLLIIKKDKDIQISNEIGRIFRGHNILEYKSPEDHLNVDTFYKTIAYACLYKAYGKTVDERKADDITISIVRETKPEGLFEYLINQGFEVSNPYHGIYYVQNKELFPTQVIVTRELGRNSHIWLKSLSNTLEKEEMRELLERIEGLTQNVDRELADAVLEVSVRANQKIVDELKGDESMCQALLEIMEPEINKIVGEARKEERIKARKEGAIETATNMLKSGKFSIEEIVEYVPKLSIEEVRTIKEGLVSVLEQN